jgi:hypothetical protein
MPTADLVPLSRQAWRDLEVLHLVGYFAGRAAALERVVGRPVGPPGAGLRRAAPDAARVADGRPGTAGP